MHALNNLYSRNVIDDTWLTPEDNEKHQNILKNTTVYTSIKSGNNLEDVIIKYAKFDENSFSEDNKRKQWWIYRDQCFINADNRVLSYDSINNNLAKLNDMRNKGNTNNKVTLNDADVYNDTIDTSRLNDKARQALITKLSQEQ